MANFLGRELQLGERERELLAYGFQILVLSEAGFIVALAAGWLAGNVGGAALCALAVGSLRVLGGGAHARHPGHCLVFAFTFFLLASLFSARIAPAGGTLLPLFSAGVWFWVYTLALGRVPVEPPGKPPLGERRRGVLRRSFFLLLALWGGLLAWFSLWAGSHPGAAQKAGAIAAGLFWVAVLLSPRGGRLLSRLEETLFGKGGERE